MVARTGTADTEWRTETVFSQLCRHCESPFPREPVLGTREASVLEWAWKGNGRVIQPAQSCMCPL